MTSYILPQTPAWVAYSAAFIRLLPFGRYRAMNQLCQQPPPAFWALMPKSLGGNAFICDLRDSISREVCFSGHYEAQETALVQAILRPGDCFVDVGANWGYFTLLATHQVGAQGKVISLEPDPRLFWRLQESVAHNHLRQVIALPIAASAEPARLHLSGYDEAGGNFGVSRITTGAASATTFEVAARPLDDVLDELNIKSVKLLKMDIEGFEGFALTGLQKFLTARRITHLLLELHPQQLAELGQSATALVHWLYDLGYQAYRIDHSPAAFRRAAYAKRLDLNAVLQPFDQQAPLDAWPHLLLTAPGASFSS